LARAIAVVLIVLMFLAPLNAQSLRESIRQAAEEAALQTQAPRKSIEPKFLWTGIGLLGAGVYLIIDSRNYKDCSSPDTLCEFVVVDRSVVKRAGIAAAVAGAALLTIGVAKAHSATTIEVTPNAGVIVRHRIALH
jgi:hypothetical protein